MSAPAQDTLMGSSSVNSEVIAAVANINMSVEKVDNAEDGEISDFHQVLREEARQRKARSETVRNKKNRRQWLRIAKNANGRNH